MHIRVFPPFLERGHFCGFLFAYLEDKALSIFFLYEFTYIKKGDENETARFLPLTTHLA